MSKIIVMDTSFFLELLSVPGDSTPEKHASAVELFQEAITENYDVYCPLCVLYETASHIADIKIYQYRITLAEKFARIVESAHAKQNPFSIVPSSGNALIVKDFTELPELCRAYQESLGNSLSLVDCTIIDVAKTLSRNYEAREKRWPSHIWTLHANLKACEPNVFEHEYF